MAAKTVFAPGGFMDPGGKVLKPKPLSAPPANPNYPTYKPPTPAAAAAAPPAAAAAPPPPPSIDWAAAMGLDPGYAAATAAADAQIANLNEAFSGANNQYSTVHQLDRSLRTGLRSNADAHAAHNTLFSGGTAQQAANVDRNNQQDRYNATQVLNSNIGVQTAAKGAAAQVATGNILAHPDWYGINQPDTSTPAPAPPPGAPGAPAPAAAPTAPKPLVTPAQLKANPRIAQTKRNAI